MTTRATRVERRLRGPRVNVRGAEVAVVRPREFSRHVVNKDVSFFMLLLAADAVTEHRRDESDMLSTERLAFEMGLVNMGCAPLGSPEIPKNLSDVDGSASSAGDSDSVADRTHNAASIVEDEEKFHSRDVFRDDILLRVMGFLPWQCVLHIRGVNKIFLRHSLTFVTVCRPVHNSTPAIFIPCHDDLLTNEKAVEAELATARGPWICSQCGMPTDSRTTCHKPCGQFQRPSGQRMFLGQLRRDGTVPMVKWLLSTVLQVPPGALMSVENHRNKTSNRGKGCAWVTLCDASVPNLLDYHHRIFYDAVRGVEGVWVVPPKGREALAAVATARGAMSDRPKHMPRNTLVVEMPLSVLPPAPPPPRPVASVDRTCVSPPPPYEISLLTSMHGYKKQHGPWRYDPYSLRVAASPLFQH
ncbi:hypothetical protein DQ04_09721000 [Trypanosoma grayi]|uniref:hypothetical protein n=1 Tax=Trypanosoma grayi TaxID=71804 RepID=UPI0004F43534|nr:hypothetical protein DQ04_09721000 [Trypanosoma grayi]KEG07462.1 hypothetical protein DQ04_09721000 [Trypanosoma grayi]